MKIQKFILNIICLMFTSTGYSVDTCLTVFEFEPDERSSSLFEKQEVMDISRTEKAVVYQTKPKTKLEIIDAILYAKKQGLKISIKGTNHSHGGHNRRQDDSGKPTSLQLDMLDFNKILSLDKKKQEVTVQPGVTWKDLSVFLNDHGLAAMTEQSSNIFSIGGSVATNIHGRDVHGPLINSILEIKYIDNEGAEWLVSRKQNPKIFRSLVGGYGALGVITEVTLKVEKNYLYEARTTKNISVDQYIEYLKDIRGKSRQIMHYGRVNISGNEPFQTVSFLEWTPISDRKELSNWKGWKLNMVEKNRWVSSLIMNLMRYSPTSRFGKAIKDYMDNIFGFPKSGSHKTKNNILNNPVQFLFDNFYNQDKSVDILQEYFVPVNQLGQFLLEVGSISTRNQLNLLNVTMRYVPQIKSSKDSLLSPYSNKSDQVAVVLYFNISENENNGNGLLVKYDGSDWTQEFIHSAQKLGGTFYWPYHRWWTKEQITYNEKQNIQEFFKVKNQLDPENLFESDFIYHLRQAEENIDKRP